jgi:hypothetical protein
MRARTALLAGALACLAALAAAGSASADRIKVALQDRDQALARSIALKRADIGVGSPWKGGATKPDLSNDLGCKSYDPKQSDLVVTGAAASSLEGPGLKLESHVQILKTPRMVQLDWQRTVTAAPVLPCLRAQAPNTPQVKLVSLGPVDFPAVARNTICLRAVLDVTTTASGTVRVMVDTVAIGKGRTEITLTTTTRWSVRAAVRPLEVRLARLLASRAPAS